jgi:hypothetical protein
MTNSWASAVRLPGPSMRSRQIDVPSSANAGAAASTGCGSGVVSATANRSSTSTGFCVSPPRTTLSLAFISSMPAPPR